MKSRYLRALALLPLGLAACGPAAVQVTVESAVVDPVTGESIIRPVENLEVQLVPFDRDFIFDSLTAAASRPEPGFPLELQIMQDSLFGAQEAQRLAEAEWLGLRERLQQINQELRQYSQAEAQYRVLFNEFNDLESRVGAAERRQAEAFRQVENLQGRVLGQLGEARVLQEQWEDEAFLTYPDVVAQRVREGKRDIMIDVTDGLGQITFRAPPGIWWVHARYRLPTEELYWNIRVDVERGDPVQVSLTRESAEVRRSF